MRQTLTLLLFVLTISSGWAQELAFKTLATKGTCILQRGSNPDDYPAIATGLKIYENDKIIITGDQSYVGLVSTDGKLLELKKGGVYNVADLSKGLIENQSSLAQKYIEFLVNDMSKQDNSLANNMKVTGSVERSLFESSISLLLPEQSTVANEKAIVKWVAEKPADRYKVTVKNLFEETVFEETTDKTQIELDFSTVKLSPEEAYSLVITDESGELTSKSVMLNVPSKEELLRLNNEVSKLKEENKGESALENMVLATYFDQNGMYLNAIPYFQQAIELEPGVDQYKIIYNRFLEKYNIPQSKN